MRRRPGKTNVGEVRSPRTSKGRLRISGSFPCDV